MRAATDRVQEATVQANGLADGCASVVFGEAYLTMQSDEHKRQIVSEAFRLLRPGGRFGLHEMSLRPDDISPETQAEVRHDLSQSIHVGARPITVREWREILESAGFEVTLQRDASMGLLHPRRVTADEGWARALKIGFNVARNRAARKRILAMRSVFGVRRVGWGFDLSGVRCSAPFGAFGSSVRGVRSNHSAAIGVMAAPWWRGVKASPASAARRAAHASAWPVVR